MPKHDFERIAADLVAHMDPDLDVKGDDARNAITEQLRLVWNARGAADIAVIDPGEDGYVSELLDVRDALRTLDR